MSAPNKPHPVSSLSFVIDRAPKSRTDLKRCFWNVTPTGDYSEDWTTGHGFAIEYMHYEQLEKHSSGNTLVNIVGDMPAVQTGIEYGFLSMVGRASRLGLSEAERLRTHYASVGARYGCGALVNQRPDGSIVIEQEDGTRAVYRREGGAT